MYLEIDMSYELENTEEVFLAGLARMFHWGERDVDVARQLLPAYVSKLHEGVLEMRETDERVRKIMQRYERNKE